MIKCLTKRHETLKEKVLKEKHLLHVVRHRRLTEKKKKNIKKLKISDSFEPFIIRFPLHAKKDFNHSI